MTETERRLWIAAMGLIYVFAVVMGLDAIGCSVWPVEVKEITR
ncbi:hypothetical protein [Synechococcus phage Yong-M3-232]|nr:hypothetical protein [Synechococcus phage Yong-M3-232]